MVYCRSNEIKKVQARHTSLRLYTLKDLYQNVKHVIANKILVFIVHWYKRLINLKAKQIMQRIMSTV
jgi:hypothetical protein